MTFHGRTVDNRPSLRSPSHHEDVRILGSLTATSPSLKVDGCVEFRLDGDCPEFCVTGRPYTPRTNGRAERFIQTCKREWAYARPYAHSKDRTAALDVFLCYYYNCHRPHWGIGRKTLRLRLTELVNNVPGCYS